LAPPKKTRAWLETARPFIFLGNRRGTMISGLAVVCHIATCFLSEMTLCRRDVGAPAVRQTYLRVVSRRDSFDSRWG